MKKHNYQPINSITLKTNDIKKYLKKNNTNTNIITKYLLIDSSTRDKESKNILSSSIILQKDPFNLKSNSNKLFVQHENNKFIEGTKINISNIVPNQKIISIRDDNNNPSFEIPLNTNVMKIFCPNNIPLTYNDNIIQITISGIRGDNGPNSSAVFLGNIPINLINDTFSIKMSLSIVEYPTLSTSYISASNSYFFIILPVVLNVPYTLPSNLYNYLITFITIGGIPISKILGVHTINKKLSNGYYIDLSEKAIINEIGGGINVTIQEVLNIIPGYPNSNNYNVKLNTSISNIISVRLKNLIFPNTQPIIRKGINDKLYWQNIEDDNYIYNITIPSGNYTPDQLQLTISNLISNIDRINTSTNYLAKHYFIISIDKNTNLVNISAYKKFLVVQPITSISPAINVNPSVLDSPGPYTLTLTFANHGITKVNTEILISGAVETFGISALIINTKFLVKSIIDNNNITIETPIINLAPIRSNTRGGNMVNIYIPDSIRLRFDFNDTVGNILGFKNVGYSNSITEFKHSHSNFDNYLNSNIFGNNSLQFSGEPYVLMSISQLNTLINIKGNINNFFTKIKLCDLPGTILYDSNVETPIVFNKIINNINNLDIAFYNKDGTLYDFSGIDHSFMLEFKCQINNNKDTNINPNLEKFF